MGAEGIHVTSEHSQQGAFHALNMSSLKPHPLRAISARGIVHWHVYERFFTNDGTRMAWRESLWQGRWVLTREKISG